MTTSAHANTPEALSSALQLIQSMWDRLSEVEHQDTGVAVTPAELRTWSGAISQIETLVRTATNDATATASAVPAGWAANLKPIEGLSAGLVTLTGPEGQQVELPVKGEIFQFFNALCAQARDAYGKIVAWRLEFPEGGSTSWTAGEPSLEQYAHLCQSDFTLSLAYSGPVASQQLEKPANSQWKDHNTAELVNALRHVAVNFRNAGQLRSQLSSLIMPLAAHLKACGPVPANLTDLHHKVEFLDALGFTRNGVAETATWVACPVCGEDGMLRVTDNEGNALISCCNHACRSNGGSSDKQNG